MKNGLWPVILTVTIFMGFLIGYSLPPMFEVGLIGGSNDGKPGVQSELDGEMEEYYKSLTADPQ